MRIYSLYWWLRVMNRNAQMEIMGLVVIVVMLTLSMFFVISFQAQVPEKKIKQTFDNDQLASNFILAFLKTSAGCRNYDMQDLIQDCATEEKIRCGGFNSCEKVNTTVKYLLEETLAKWGKDYKFTIEGTNEPIEFGVDCGPGIPRKLSLQPITLYPYTKTAKIKLVMCG